MNCDCDYNRDSLLVLKYLLTGSKVLQRTWLGESRARSAVAAADLFSKSLYWSSGILARKAVFSRFISLLCRDFFAVLLRNIWICPVRERACEVEILFVFPHCWLLSQIIGMREQRKKSGLPHLTRWRLCWRVCPSKAICWAFRARRREEATQRLWWLASFLWPLSAQLDPRHERGMTRSEPHVPHIFR